MCGVFILFSRRCQIIAILESTTHHLCPDWVGPSRDAERSYHHAFSEINLIENGQLSKTNWKNKSPLESDAAGSIQLLVSCLDEYKCCYYYIYQLFSTRRPGSAIFFTNNRVNGVAQFIIIIVMLGAVNQWVPPCFRGHVKPSVPVFIVFTDNRIR